MVSTIKAVSVPAGEFLMGSEDFYPDEAPVRRMRVEACELAERPVTNDEFAAFVADTGYVTVAERPLDPGEFPQLNTEQRAPGSLVFTGAPGPVPLDDWRRWWAWRPGACWRHPYGPGDTIAGRGAHPVVQVAYADALAYAEWAGMRLPKEAEWEHAALGGADAGTPYAWGREAQPGGALRANTWQGAFPYRNTGANGWVGTSPVGAFPANGYGLFDMIGNVWEWTADRYTEQGEAAAHEHAACGRGRDAPTGTAGAERGHDAQPACHTEATGPACGCGADARGPEAAGAAGRTAPRRVTKGGSHLCAPEYCLRYRPAARSPQAEDSATTHIGFRVAGLG